MQKLDIYNKILIKLGCETTTDINVDTKPVRLINEEYEYIKQLELQKHNWIFAKKQKALYCKAITDTVSNLASCILANVELSASENILTVTAKNVGVNENSITLKSSNNKICVSGETLTGGTEDAKATGTIVFNVNINKGDVITIDDIELVAGTDFVIGKKNDGKFSGKFELPNDCLLLLEILGYGTITTYPYQFGANKLYDLAERYIYTNKEKVVIDYISNIDDDKLDVSFIDVFTSAVAFELAEAITQSDQKIKTLYERYLVAVKAAKRINTIQIPNMSVGSGVLERSRL